MSNDDDGFDILSIRAQSNDDRKPLKMISGEALSAFDELALAAAHMIAARSVYELALERFKRASAAIGRAPR